MSNYENYYETYVIKNPTSKIIARKLLGGEVTAWSMGHQLRLLNFYRDALEKIAEGRATFPEHYAQRFLEIMKTCESKCKKSVEQTARKNKDD